MLLVLAVRKASTAVLDERDEVGEFQFGEKRSDLFDVEPGAFEVFKFNV